MLTQLVGGWYMETIPIPSRAAISTAITGFFILTSVMQNGTGFNNPSRLLCLTTEPVDLLGQFPHHESMLALLGILGGDEDQLRFLLLLSQERAVP